MKRILLAIGLLVLLAVSASAVWVYRDLHTPVRHAKHGQYVEIARGSSPAAVVNKLADEGIIRHRLPLTLYLKLTSNGSQLKAGEYDFPSPISPRMQPNNPPKYPEIFGETPVFAIIAAKFFTV